MPGIPGMKRARGRPVDPDSERSRQPWAALGMSRATYAIRKRYDDLPKLPMKFRADFKKSCVHKLTADDVRYIKRFLLERPYPEHKWLLVDFDIDQATLADILNERTHRDVAV